MTYVQCVQAAVAVESGRAAYRYYIYFPLHDANLQGFGIVKVRQQMAKIVSLYVCKCTFFLPGDLHITALFDFCFWES